MIGACKNIIERSVVLSTTTANMKAKNRNMSLIREKTKVLSAALIV